MMTELNLEPTDRVLAQGKALARAIAAMETIEPSGVVGRFLELLGKA